MKATATVASTKVNTTGGAAGASQVTTVTKAVFTIAVKGLSEVREELNFSLHVGADSTAENKINMNIAMMSARALGINGLDVSGDTSTNATGAIDTIAIRPAAWFPTREHPWVLSRTDLSTPSTTWTT